MARYKEAEKPRIVDPTCLHDWQPDRHGSRFEVCFKCWSSREPYPNPPADPKPGDFVDMGSATPLAELGKPAVTAEGKP